MVCDQYKSQGLFRAEKADPPMRVMGGGPSRRFIYMKNPFLDFIGVWRERAGRAVMFEAKSTREPRLPVGYKNGLTASQVEAMRHWHAHGAVTFCLWECRGLVQMVHLGHIKTLDDNGQKSIEPGACEAVPIGRGYVLFDFLQVMRRLWPA